MVPTSETSQEALSAALAALRRAACDNLARTTEILERLDRFESQLDAGCSIHEVVAQEQRPIIVEMLSLNMATLETHGAEFRAAQARALHDEGVTIHEIGELFGVTRQRISSLLR